MKPVPSSIGYKSASGKVSDAKLHEEIMAGVDDSALRLMSAQRAIEKLGMTQAEAEEVFGVTFPPQSP